MTGRKNRRHFLKNLLIILLLFFLWWNFTGYPLPMELDLHRSERQHLADRSEVIWRYDSRRSVDRRMLVGLSPTAVSTYREGGRYYIWPRNEEGCTLVALPDRTRYYDKGDYIDPAMVVPDPPPRAESARLTMTLNINSWTEDYVIDGEKQGDIFFFQFRRNYRHRPENWEDLPMEQLEAWDALSDNEDAAFWLLTTFFDAEELASYPYTLEFFDYQGNLIRSLRNEGWLADQ